MHKADNILTEAIATITEQIRWHKRRCIIIHGEIGEGKTRFAEGLVIALRKREFRVGGIISPRTLDGTETIGYRVRDIETGEELSFATLNPPGIPIGKFYLSAGALAFARAVIERAASTDQIVLVDEVGRLELGGKGHAIALRVLLQSDVIPVLFARTTFVERIIDTFDIADHATFPTS